MLIPNDRHPYGGVQRRLQAYDKSLWLVFAQRIQRWVVVMKRDSTCPTHHALRGMPGCCGARCHYELGTVLAAPGGEPLNPLSVGSLLVSCVARNDQRHQSVADRIRAVDERHIERRRIARVKLSEIVREAVAETFRTVAVGKVVGVGNQVIDYQAPYRFQPSQNRKVPDPKLPNYRNVVRQIRGEPR